MNILLIGHRGYLGKGLLAYLNRGHRVIGWDKEEDIFALDAGLLAREKIDLVVNLAVMADRGSGPYQLDTPGDRVNVTGARHLANVLRGTDIGWIQMSTREVLPLVYGPQDVTETPDGLRPNFLIDEECQLWPRNPYGKSKLMSEFISETHRRSAVIRLTTCYTDYDHPAGNWVVSLVRAAVYGKPVTLTQGGLQFRDPLHIDDLGRLMELVQEKQAWGQKFHAGGGESNLISLLEFVKRANPNVVVERAAGGDYGFAFDNRKAREATGWEPRVQVRDRIPVIADNIRAGITEP
jgi:nucleoside-diphosphate-sugar epimerase